MKQLTVKKVGAAPADAAEVHALLESNGVGWQPVDCVDWADDYPYAPKVLFRIAHTGSSILLEYSVEEDSVAAVADGDNGRVWEDSCCEFFSCPADDGVYYNMECNCVGTLLIGCGAEREGRERAPKQVLELVKRWSSLGRQNFEERVQPTSWQMALIIPKEAFYHHQIATLSGLKITANFYKCGDKLQKPHFLSWNKITLAKPDFHRPDFFGQLEFE